MLRYSWLLVLAACTAAVPNGASDSVTQAASECVAPRAMMSHSSPFFEALATWDLAGFERACALSRMSDERRTEHGACTALGLAYASGDGVTKNPKRALDYLALGASCGLTFGAHDLGNVRSEGIFSGASSCCGGVMCARGCEADCKSALASVNDAVAPALEKACADNHASACFMLSGFLNGDYLPNIGFFEMDEKRRIELLEKSCALGLGPACVDIAWTWNDDPDKIPPWLEKGCAADWGYACLMRGHHVPVVQAFPWWQKACDLGLDRVCHDLDEIP